MNRCANPECEHNGQPWYECDCRFQPAEPPTPESIHDFEMAAMCYGKIDECATCGQPEAADIHNLALKDELEWNAREDAARAKPAQPPVVCEHQFVAIAKDGVAVRWTYLDNLACEDCNEPMVVRPAAQWADVETLPERLEAMAERRDTTPGSSRSVACGIREALAELRKALGLERAKGEG